MIFVTNAEGRATYVGSEWTEYTGQSLEDAVDFGWIRVVHPDDREITRKIVGDAIRAQSAFSMRYRMLTPDGRAIWVAAGAVPSFGPPDHTFLGFLGSITQISEALTAGLQAYGSLGQFVPPPAHPATQPESGLELLADHLLAAHAIVEQADVGRVRPLIELALHVVGFELAQSEPGGRASSQFH